MSAPRSGQDEEEAERKWSATYAAQVRQAGAAAVPLRSERSGREECGRVPSPPCSRAPGAGTTATVWRQEEYGRVPFPPLFGCRSLRGRRSSCCRS